MFTVLKIQCPSLPPYTVCQLIVFCGYQGHHHLPETRGLCLSEEQTVSTVRVVRNTNRIILSSFNHVLP
jgi:hypothetical protein